MKTLVSMESELKDVKNNQKKLFCDISTKG